ncbi:hypothetical protein RIF29_16198 [Crotalaria pallida]|uniref:Uncharacterized protein n=1 Tax=Crotalaria pallida TaxID=3830 RepID=A0AAN9FGU1_CROPI
MIAKTKKTPSWHVSQGHFGSFQEEEDLKIVTGRELNHKSKCDPLLLFLSLSPYCWKPDSGNLTFDQLIIKMYRCMIEGIFFFICLLHLSRNGLMVDGLLDFTIIYSFPLLSLLNHWQACWFSFSLFTTLVLLQSLT